MDARKEGRPTHNLAIMICESSLRPSTLYLIQASHCLGRSCPSVLAVAGCGWWAAVDRAGCHSAEVSGKVGQRVGKVTVLEMDQDCVCP